MTAPPDPQLGEPAIDTALLGRLLESQSPLSVQALATKLAFPHARVLSELDRLRDAGCELDHNPQHGLTLTRAGLGCWADYLRATRAGAGIVEVYQTTASTQDAARRLIADRCTNADGALVIADEQSAGRGRLGRRWIAPPGSALMFSRVCLTPSPDDTQAINRLTYAACVGLAQALDIWLVPLGKRAEIKWPNDVLIDGRKIAGILVEVVQDRVAGHFAIIGVGLNVGLTLEQLPTETQEPGLRNRVTSLAMLGAHADRLAVLTQAVLAIDHALDESHADHLLEQWRERSTLIGKHVRLSCEGIDYQGEVVDLDPSLGLILRTTTGTLVHMPASTTTILV